MESGLTVANLWKPAGARFTLQAAQNVYPIELVTQRSIPSSVSCISGLLQKARGHFVCWQGVPTKNYRDISRRRNAVSAQKGPRFM